MLRHTPKSTRTDTPLPYPPLFRSSLTEDNISLLAGMSYTAPSGALLYATFSRGYKAGAFSNISASSTSQYVPARQERVDAYEAGAKLDRKSTRLNSRH